MATNKTSKKTAETPGDAGSTDSGPAVKGTMSKADFVRARAGLPAKEVVAQAKAEGITMGESYVHNVRGGDARPAKARKTASKTRNSPTNKKPELRAAPVRKAPAVPRPIESTASAEDLLKAVAAEIGLVRAAEILAQERARVRAVIGH